MSKDYYITMQVKVYKPTENTTDLLQQKFGNLKIKDELRTTSCIVMEIDDERNKRGTTGDTSETKS